jgi:hypothetical protein
VFADIPSTCGQCLITLFGAFCHQSVMVQLVCVAILVFREAANFGLVFDPFFGRHELPAARIVFIGAPWATR